jgi:hypothetical protein
MSFMACVAKRDGGAGAGEFACRSVPREEVTRQVRIPIPERTTPFAQRLEQLVIGVAPPRSIGRGAWLERSEATSRSS